MYCQTLMHIPEVITGLGGALLIGIALLSSIRFNRREARRGHTETLGSRDRAP